MTSKLNIHDIALQTRSHIPSWATFERAQTLENMSFLSGAALATLHPVLDRRDVPQTLLRARLALSAAEACVTFSGRLERAEDLRDAVHFLRPGDSPGPAGEVYLCWQRAVERPISIKALRRALPTHPPDKIKNWFDARGRGGAYTPIAQANQVLEAVLTQSPRAETPALILADAALSQALGREYIIPLLASGLKRSDLLKRGDELRLACHCAVNSSVADAVQIANNLAWRTARLNAISSKLRAKGAGAALELLLTTDAVTPTALASLNSDRAARRFCDRLVGLGVVRKLTGRDTFRLYGV
jgi:hypothetical protein